MTERPVGLTLPGVGSNPPSSRGAGRCVQVSVITGDIEMHVPERVIRPQPNTEWVASAELPTRFGLFTTHVFRSTDPPGDGASYKEHVALVYGQVEAGRALPIRIHSECMTSEVFGSLKCDCKEQ